MGADLTQVSTGALRALRDRLKGGGLQDPLTPRDAADVPPLLGVPCAEAARALDFVLAERAARPHAPELVWTGPAPVHAAMRDTAMALKGLFTRAQKRVIVAGYAFDHGDAIFAPLHDAMITRGVTVDLFVHLPIADADRPKLKTDEGRVEVIEQGVTTFLAQNWPGQPHPRLHYDPRPVHEQLYASLHAKCVVVDEREALVTSANFTHRAQERNVEVGALIKDPVFARSLAAQWMNALEHGLFRSYGAGG